MPADVAAPCWAQEDLFLKVFLSALLPKHVILITKCFAILFLCALKEFLCQVRVFCPLRHLQWK